MFMARAHECRPRRLIDSTMGGARSAVSDRYDIRVRARTHRYLYCAISCKTAYSAEWLALCVCVLPRWLMGPAERPCDVGMRRVETLFVQPRPVRARYDATIHPNDFPAKALSADVSYRTKCARAVFETVFVKSTFFCFCLYDVRKRNGTLSCLKSRAYDLVLHVRRHTAGELSSAIASLHASVRRFPCLCYVSFLNAKVHTRQNKLNGKPHGTPRE